MTRKRRYLISAAILATCICIALGVLAMLPERPGVSKANFYRIEDGMTVAKVDAILGEPARRRKSGNNMPFEGRMWYHADGSQIVVWSGNTGKVWSAEFRPSTESFTDMVRRWLYLPK